MAQLIPPSSCAMLGGSSELFQSFLVKPEVGFSLIFYAQKWINL